MKTAPRISPQTMDAARKAPPFIFNAAFEEPDADTLFGATPEVAGESTAPSFMPDEVTRAWTKCMHYAAWKVSRAASQREATRWRRRYYDCRDRIVMGNHKLTFRAVHKWGASPQIADDMTGECQIVLIKAVAAFNPWMGIRFSTYAFTCLMRALSRLSQRQAADRLGRSLPLDSMPYGEPCYVVGEEEPSSPSIARLDEFLGTENTLLTAREKIILIRRFHLQDDATKTETLEEVGRDLGLSKERVRQVQMSALGKLRGAMLTGTPMC